MKFRLAVVGHRDTVRSVAELVREYFDQVEVLKAEFGNDDTIDDAVEYIARLQSRCDGILYSRKDPYLLIARHLHHRVPVRYVDIDRSHLLISLLRAVLEYDTVPTDISIDSFDHLSAVEALTSVGIPKERVTIRTVTADIGRPGFVNAILTQHLSNHRDGAQLCITNVTDVHRTLLKKGVPTTLITPSTESYVHEIRNLLLRHRLRNQEASPLAIMHIRLQYKEKYRFYGEMPIREVDDLSTAAKLIAMFAEELDGAMFHLSRWEYVLLCNRAVLESATEQFVNIDLMRAINVSTAFDVTIAIGCGQTIREAESNALLATNETLAHPGTNAVIVCAPGQVLGPISPKSEHFPQESATETRLADVAAATGVSTHVLHQIYQVTRQRNSNLFTSAQLAEALDVSTRTVNRIIERLLDHRYAVIEGKDLTQPYGRPARVIRLLF